MRKKAKKGRDDAIRSRADEIVAEAQRKADEMVSKAKAEAERRRNMAQRGSGIDELIREAEEKAKVEANKIFEDNKTKAEALKKIPEDTMKAALEFVLKEVLPQ